MVTSILEMLELPNFSHITKSSMWCELRNKIFVDDIIDRNLKKAFQNCVPSTKNTYSHQDECFFLLTFLLLKWKRNLRKYRNVLNSDFIPVLVFKDQINASFLKKVTLCWKQIINGYFSIGFPKLFAIVIYSHWTSYVQNKLI